MAEASDQVLLDDTICRGLRVCSPPRFFNLDILPGNLLECSRQVGRDILARVLRNQNVQKAARVRLGERAGILLRDPVLSSQFFG